MVSHSAHTSTHHFSVCATLREALLIRSQRKKGRKGERNKNNIKTCSSAYLIKLTVLQAILTNKARQKGVYHKGANASEVGPWFNIQLD